MHCDGCGHGSSLFWLLLVLAGAAALGLHAAWPSITSTATAVLEVVVAVALVVLKVLATAVGLAVAGALTWTGTTLGIRAHRSWHRYIARKGHSPVAPLVRTARCLARAVRRQLPSARRARLRLSQDLPADAQVIVGTVTSRRVRV